MVAFDPTYQHESFDARGALEKVGPFFDTLYRMVFSLVTPQVLKWSFLELLMELIRKYHYSFGATVFLIFMMAIVYTYLCVPPSTIIYRE